MGKAKTGIAFGGGGARGIAHVGAIRVFQEYGVDFDYVAGNSAGAIAGALYAAGIPWRKLYEYVLDIKQKLPAKTLLTYIDPHVVQDLADHFLKGKTFDDLNKPFCATAVDLERGTLETLNRGRVSAAVSASCAVPGIFRPVRIGDRIYIDGGTLRSIPTEAVRKMGAEKVVGIDLNSDKTRGTHSTKRLKVMITALNISTNANSRLCEQYSDIMLKPALEGYPTHSFKSVENVLRIGERTAMENLARIKELVG
ncbi:MAG: patatin-like phospholipase family protein [Burkholderiales bacterium]